MEPHWSQDVFVKAWDFATKAHHGQTYAGPAKGERIDYINHIGSVVMELIWGLGTCSDYDANLAIQCALLHDVIEDTQVDHETLLAEFGADVANGVKALTKDETLPSKREQIIESLIRIRKQPREIWMVKMADRITNLSEPPHHWSKQKRIDYREEAIIIFDSLADANKPLANRLSQRIETYAQYIE